MRFQSLLFVLILLKGAAVVAEPLHIAVATSFRPTLEKIIRRYQTRTHTRCLVSAAATGVLYAQIVNGANFDLLLAADDWRPARLIEQGLALKEDRASYAYGKLVLIGRGSELNAATPETIAAWLRRAGVRIAIANPATAPFGQAARHALKTLQLWEVTRDQRVIGQNAAQALHYFITGNVNFAFVGLGQWHNGGAGEQRSFWLVPPHAYPPIRQDAVVLNRSGNLPRARHFLAFLRGSQAREIMLADGYGVDPQA